MYFMSEVQYLFIRVLFDYLSEVVKMNGMLSVFPYLGLAYTFQTNIKVKKIIFLTPAVLFKKVVILLLHVSGEFI